jgi:hypothetical protein
MIAKKKQQPKKNQREQRKILFYFQGSKIHLKKLQIENVNIDRTIILEMIEVYYSPLCCLILKIVKHPVVLDSKNSKTSCEDHNKITK